MKLETYAYTHSGTRLHLLRADRLRSRCGQGVAEVVQLPPSLVDGWRLKSRSWWAPPVLCGNCSYYVALDKRRAKA